MTLQTFIFTSGIWLGEGKISFTASPEFLKFYTKWKISEKSPGIMEATQTVEILGVEEHLVNHFVFQDITPTSFSVQLENPLIGKLSGTGLRDARTIAWEFKNESTFQGFEVYEKQENDDFFFHAEYGEPNEFRSKIEGLIWQKSNLV